MKNLTLMRSFTVYFQFVKKWTEEYRPISHVLHRPKLQGPVALYVSRHKQFFRLDHAITLCVTNVRPLCEYSVIKRSVPYAGV